MLRNRYRRIIFFFARIIISFAIWDIFIPRIGLRAWSRRNRPHRLSKSAAQFRTLAVQMGGVLIKVGQFFSARVDVLPDEVTNELAGLQDEVPQEDFSDICSVVESEFGLPLEEKFTEFASVPVAAASLGQVHQAKILADNASSDDLIPSQNGYLQVVVKVQRPDIREIIATDLAALRTVGRWLQRYRPISKRADVPALLAEFSRILYEEIDYIAEGHNAETFAENFSQRPGIRVPHVIWSHTTKRVLSLEDVQAIKITDYQAISAAGIDRGEVAERLFGTYLQQIFEDGFFHADPHPGNLFVSPLLGQEERSRQRDEPEIRQEYNTPWELTFVDFGMVGREPANLRDALRELVISVGTRDAARVVKAYQMMGVLLPNADLSLIERAEGKVFDHFWGKNMSELQNISPQEIGEFTQEFRQLIYAMPFQIPQDLILLGRTVGILAGMCTGLNPEFNVWDGLTPYAQKLISEEAVATGKIWLEQIAVIMRSMLTYPKRIENILYKIEHDEISVHDPRLLVQISKLQGSVNRAAAGLVFAALLLGGIQLYLSGNIAFGWSLIVMAWLALGWILLSRKE